MASRRHPRFGGIFPSLPTVLTRDGEIDEEGQRSVVRFCLNEGAHGLSCMLFAGEFYKFSDAERSRVAKIVVEEAAGRVPVLVGISHSGTIPSIRLGMQAVEVGADGVVVTPPYHANFSQEAAFSTLKHYTEIASRLDVPVMIQDYESASGGGVRLSARDLDTIARESSSVRYVKVEGGDHMRRIKDIIDLMGDRMTIFGGMGGRMLIEELKIGTAGTIPGAEMTDRLVTIYESVKRGDALTASSAFNEVSPYLEFMSRHFESFVAIQKRVLKAKGVITSPAVREPQVPLSPKATSELSRIIRRMGID